jgi:hypothetical protein
MFIVVHFLIRFQDEQASDFLRVWSVLVGQLAELWQLTGSGSASLALQWLPGARVVLDQPLFQQIQLITSPLSQRDPLLFAFGRVFAMLVELLEHDSKPVSDQRKAILRGFEAVDDITACQAAVFTVSVADSIAFLNCKVLMLLLLCCMTSRVAVAHRDLSDSGSFLEVGLQKFFGCFSDVFSKLPLSFLVHSGIVQVESEQLANDIVLARVC